MDSEGWTVDKSSDAVEAKNKRESLIIVKQFTFILVSLAINSYILRFEWDYAHFLGIAADYDAIECFMNKNFEALKLTRIPIKRAATKSKTTQNKWNENVNYLMA